MLNAVRHVGNRLNLIRCLVTAVTLALLLPGCRSIENETLAISAAPAEVSGPAAGAIAGDMVSRLAEQIGQGKATVALNQDGSPFGQALEAALKGWGYAVVTDQKTDSGAPIISLAYVIMPYDGQILARVSTSAVELCRVYTVTTSGATPISALSLMRRG
ncbi:conjugal transfer protein TrbH [Agrobacterium sp. SORGH_AS 787]|uniref:conjugal transfer protein TrbH n=1 Tax=Agrobacterium sp. SORGH_AS 787 TaxID=3041775 RepID=UPI0027892889|nr:hypothetical protein [Rhizobium sp. SORGH_AS_0787]